MHWRIASLIVVVLLASCAVSQWSRVEPGHRDYTGAHFVLQLPEGWMRIDDDARLLLSKDGPDLQRIFVEYRPHEQAFPKLEKQSSPLMLPSELAELTIAELKLSQEGGLPSLEVLRNEPFDIAGRLGFGLHLAYRTDAGLRVEMLARGFVDERGFYLVTYRAPKLYYFDRDRAEFDLVVASMRVPSGGG